MTGSPPPTASVRTPWRGSRAALPPGPLAVAVAAVLVVWTTIDVLRGGWWASVDAEASDLVRETGIPHSSWPEALVYVFTQFGARGTVLAVLVPLVVIVARRRGTWQPVLRFAVAIALLTVTVYAMKYAVGRIAPPEDAVHAGGASYPSGHAANAVLMWGLAAWLAVEYRLPGRVVRLASVLRFAGPAATAVSMLLLDYHWLTDMTVGLAVGVILLWALHLIFAGRLGQWGDAGGTDRGAGRGGDADVRERDRAAGGPAGVRG